MKYATNKKDKLGQNGIIETVCPSLLFLFYIKIYLKS